MTLASCAPEGTAARFQNSSPRAAPRGGDRPPPSRTSPGPLTRPSRLASRVPCSTPSRRRVSISLTGMVPSRRQGQETGRERQRANTPSRAIQRPQPRARCSRGPHPARPDRRKSWGPQGRPRDAGTLPAPAPLASVSGTNWAGACPWRARGWDAREGG